MKKKILTLIMLIILFIVSVSSLIVLSINAFANDGVINDIEYPIWLDSSFYEDKEEPIKENIIQYNTIHDHDIKKDIDTFLKDYSFTYEWFGSYLYNEDNLLEESDFLNIDESIFSKDNTFIGTNDFKLKKEIDETLIVGLDQTIDINNVTSIDNSIIGSDNELTIGTEESINETLTIENSIIYSYNNSVFDQLSKYKEVNINNSIIISKDIHHVTGIDNDWSNINISNSIITDAFVQSEIEEDKLNCDSDTNELISLLELNINENVYYDDFLNDIINSEI